MSAAPAATPKAIVDQLNTEMAAVLRDPSVAPKMSGLTYDPVHKPTAEFARRIKNDYEVVGKLFHDYNVKLD